MAKPSAIKSLSNLTLDSVHLRTLIFAPPGSGKTPIIAERPKTLILNADGGEMSAAGKPAEVWRIKEWSDMTEAFDYIQQEGYQSYDWVWLDSITIAQVVGMDTIMRDLVLKKSHRVREKPDQAEYLENMNRLYNFVLDMFRLPVNFGITAHSMEADDGTGEFIQVPLITQKNMWQKTTALFDVIGYLGKTEKGTPCLFFEKEGFLVRDRLQLTENGKMLNPSIKKIEDALAARISAQPRPAAKKIPAKKAAPTRRTK